MKRGRVLAEVLVVLLNHSRVKAAFRDEVVLVVDGDPEGVELFRLLLFVVFFFLSHRRDFQDCIPPVVDASEYRALNGGMTKRNAKPEVACRTCCPKLRQRTDCVFGGRFVTERIAVNESD